MKLKSVSAKKAGVIALIIVLLLAAGTVVLAAGEVIFLQRAVEIALRDNPAVRLATVRARRARVGAEQLRERVDAAVYRLVAGEMLRPDELSLVYVGPVQAEQLENLAPHRERADRALLVMETQKNYLELHRALDRLKLARQAKARLREQLRLAEVAFQAGTAARSEILTAQAQVAVTEARVFSAESNVLAAQATLNKSLGRPLAEVIDLPESFSVPKRETLDLQKGLTWAEARRLEIIVGRETLRVRERELAHGLHTLDSASQREAELAVEEARLQLQMAVQAVSLEVFQLYHRLSGLEKQLIALEEGVRAAAEAHRLAVLRYKLGVGIQLEVIIAGDVLLEREQDLLHARYEGYLGYLSWRLATGQPLE